MLIRLSSSGVGDRVLSFVILTFQPCPISVQVHEILRILWAHKSIYVLSSMAAGTQNTLKGGDNGLREFLQVWVVILYKVKNDSEGVPVVAQWKPN